MSLSCTSTSMYPYDNVRGVLTLCYHIVPRGSIATCGKRLSKQRILPYAPAKVVAGPVALKSGVTRLLFSSLASYNFFLSKKVLVINERHSKASLQTDLLAFHATGLFASRSGLAKGVHIQNVVEQLQMYALQNLCLAQKRQRRDSNVCCMRLVQCLVAIEHCSELHHEGLLEAPLRALHCCADTMTPNSSAGQVDTAELSKAYFQRHADSKVATLIRCASANMTIYEQYYCTNAYSVISRHFVQTIS